MAVAGAATQLLPQASAQEKEKIDINSTLQNIANTLRAEPFLASVEEHLVPNPSIGLKQWRWWHFRPDLDEAQFPEVEKVNADLLPAMKTVHALPNSGLDMLLQEGFVTGRIQSQILDYRQTHRQVVELQNTFTVPLAPDIRPSQETIEREMANSEHVTKSVYQFVFPNGKARQVKISPLARFGAGFILAHQNGVELFPAEDPAIDAQAERAEQSGDKDEYDKWVLRERDAHFIKIVRESKRHMMHLLVGASHDLTDDIAVSNDKNLEKISHLVVTVKSLRAHDNIAKK